MAAPSPPVRLATVSDLVVRRASLVLAETDGAVRRAVSAGMSLVIGAIARASREPAVAQALVASVDGTSGDGAVAAAISWVLDGPTSLDADTSMSDIAEPSPSASPWKEAGFARHIFAETLDDTVAVVCRASGAEPQSVQRILDALGVGALAVLREQVLAGDVGVDLADSIAASAEAGASVGAVEDEAPAISRRDAPSDRVATTIADAYAHERSAASARLRAPHALSIDRGATQAAAPGPSSHPFVLAACAGLGAGLLVFGVWPPADRMAATTASSMDVARFTRPHAPQPEATAEEPSGVASADATTVFVGRDQTTATRMALEWARVARSASPPAEIAVAGAPSAIDALLTAEHPPAGVAAIVRYDTLDRAQRLHAGPEHARPAPRAALRVVMPLLTEEFHFLVERDSPLHFIHEIRDRRIGTALAGAETEVSVAALYRRLFDDDLPVSTQAFATAREAIDALLRDPGLEVVALVDGRPAAALATLDAAARSRLRLLSLAPGDPTTHRVTRGYLPVVIDHESYPGWLAEDVTTLAVMSFLVTATGQDAHARASVLALPAALCARLPVLWRSGHPKWAELQAGVSLPTGIPMLPGAGAAVAGCPMLSAAGTGPADTPASRPAAPGSAPRDATARRFSMR